MPGHRTEIRSRWTSRNLYLLFACPYEQLNLKPEPNTETETNELWKWDVAEVFIGSELENIRRYREFEISPQGEWIDLDIDLDAPRHEDGWVWNSGLQVAARIDPTAKIWYAFLRIPYAAVDTRRRNRQHPQSQFLPWAGIATQSQSDHLATDSPSHLSRPGGFRDAAACRLTSILAENLGKHSSPFHRRTRPGARLRPAAGHRAQHEQHGGGRAVHHDPADHRRDGRAAMHAGLAAGRGAGALRRPGLERTGGGDAGHRRHVPLPARSLPQDAAWAASCRFCSSGNSSSAVRWKSHRATSASRNTSATSGAAWGPRKRGWSASPWECW